MQLRRARLLRRQAETSEREKPLKAVLIIDEDGNVCFVTGLLKAIRKQLNKSGGSRVHVAIKERGEEKMMWKCPKCGRTFKKENQSHYCGDAPHTVDEYIFAQDEEIRSQLQSVREVLITCLPDAVEKISWAMPTYRKEHNIIHFAAQKKHIGLYPGPEAVSYFSEKLDRAGCKYSKGSVRIPYSDHLPLELIAEIASWCRDTGNHA